LLVSARVGRSMRNGVIDRDATGAAAEASDIDDGFTAGHPFVDAVSGRAKLQDASGIVVDDRQHGGIRGAECSPAGGVAQSEIHGLVGLIERVFDDGDSESLAGYSRAESERTGRRGVVGTSSGGFIAGWIIDCHAAGAATGAGCVDDGLAAARTSFAGVSARADVRGAPGFFV